MIYPATQQVIRRYVDRSIEAPDWLTTISLVLKAPPLPFIPAELHGKLVLLMLVVFVGDQREGQAALEPLRSLGPGGVDLTAPMPYSAWRLRRPAT